jgi:hypothetical protein
MSAALPLLVYSHVPETQESNYQEITEIFGEEVNESIFLDTRWLAYF